MEMLKKITVTRASAAVLLIRLVVGAVFLSEGIQKFVFPADLGTGRFVKIGIPWPGFMAPFVGGCEIVCGTLALIGAAYSTGEYSSDHRHAGCDLHNQSALAGQERLLGDGP
jgi:uncharacterized membrane protein YphA (DoxX/SURF4 family)